MTIAVVNYRPGADWRRSVPLRTLALAGVFGAFLSTAGVLDTEAAPTPERLLYWVAISFLGAAALQGFDYLLAATRPAMPASWRRGAGLFLLVLPLTLVGVYSCKLLFGGRPSGAGFLLMLPGMACILAALQVSLALFMPGARRGPTPASRMDGARADAPTLPLPLPLRGARVEALEAEDHYVRVHTSLGSALLRMRFRDALAAVAVLDGTRPHRSWWVANEAAASLGRCDGRLVLTLKNGLRVPVSRTHRSSLGPGFSRGRQTTGPRGSA